MSLKIMHLDSLLHLPGASELKADVIFQLFVNVTTIWESSVYMQ